MSAPIVISVVNHKGGVGKTTTAVNLATALATGNSELGISSRRVLLVDLDPKGNAATTFGIDKRSLGPTMNELFKGGVEGAPVTLNQTLLGPGNLTESMKNPGLDTILNANAASLHDLNRQSLASSCRPRFIWS